MPLRFCIERSEAVSKEMGSESNDKVGISLFVTPKFSELEAVPNSKNVSNLEITKTDSFLGTEISPLSNSKKETRSESNDKVGISLSLVERVLRSESNDKVKISPFENKSNSKQCISGISDGISFECFSGICSQNFSNPSAELGRVKVAKHNLQIKTFLRLPCTYYSLFV